MQMGNLANSVSEEMSLRRKYEAPLSMAALKRSASLNRSASLARRSHPELSAQSQGSPGVGFARCLLHGVPSIELA